MHTAYVYYIYIYLLSTINYNILYTYVSVAETSNSTTDPRSADHNLRTTDRNYNVYYVMCRCNKLILKFTKKSMALEFIQSRKYDTADS